MTIFQTMCTTTVLHADEGTEDDASIPDEDGSTGDDEAEGSPSPSHRRHRRRSRSSDGAPVAGTYIHCDVATMHDCMFISQCVRMCAQSMCNHIRHVFTQCVCVCV